MIKRLCMFDFDGTLFRSPERPAWWPHTTWWSHLGSLNPPCVPDQPSDDWWVPQTTQAAKAALVDGETHTVLLTGRLAEHFSSRVRALLDQRGLAFDDVRLCDSDDTVQWKAAQLQGLLQDHPTLTVVETWDDRHEQFDAFYDITVKAGLTLIVHPVAVEPHAVACEESGTGSSGKTATERIIERFLARNG